MFSVKQLIAGIVLIIVIGVAGFLYRNAMEHPPTLGGNQIACTMEAKLCPDGSGVGRQGPNCEFAACAFPPNVDLKNAGLAFAIPTAYVKGVQEPGADGMVENQLDFYQKPALGSVQHFISVYRFPIPEGKTGEQIILENTRYQPADMQAENFSKFTTKILSDKTFRTTVIERFEGQVMSSYFLVRAADVLRFDILERDVPNWTDPGLIIENLPEHQALRTMLASIQTI